MALTEEQKKAIKRLLSRLYGTVGRTGYNMAACWERDEYGNITGTVDVACLRAGGKAIGQKIKALWGKS